MSVLVVDDDPVILNLVTDILTDAGYNVSSAGDSFAALETLKESEYDLVVTDIRMPRMSRLEMIKEVKKISSRTKCTLMTGFGDLEIEAI